LLDLAFLVDLTAKLNLLNTELQGENKTIIKMIGTIDSFKGKLQLWKTQLKKGVLTHIPSVQSPADGTFDASVLILCIDELLKEFERRFKDFERMKFTVPFITDPFQERDKSESAELISSVFKENVSELKLEIVNFQTDLSLKTRVNDKNFWNLVPSAQCPVLKLVALKVSACFGSTYVSESGFSTMKILKSKIKDHH
jgi:hypothetical protein